MVHDTAEVFDIDEDQVTEFQPDDPCLGDDPESWPAWTDLWLWEVNADDAEPTVDDVAWLAEHPTLPPISGGSPEPYEPSDQDWDDFAAWSSGLFTDDDVAAAGLPVG